MKTGTDDQRRGQQHTDTVESEFHRHHKLCAKWVNIVKESPFSYVVVDVPFKMHGCPGTGNVLYDTPDIVF